MKFQHLPLGARFVYQGEIFTKISPLVASVDGGGQRMIPRYASLSPVDGVEITAPAKPQSAMVEIERVWQALDTLEITLAQSALDDAAVKLAVAQCREAIRA
jgi:hypothetical protein